MGINLSNATIIKSNSKSNIENVNDFRGFLNKSDFTNYWLTIYSKFFTSLSTNSKFKNKLYRQIDLQFDGDDNVLLIDLFDNSDLSLNDSLKKFLSINYPQISADSLLNIFNEIDNENYYPQIYIANYSQFNENYFDTIFSVAYYGREDIDNYEGYFLNNGKVVTYKNKINSKTLEVKQVWILSINETVNSDGRLEDMPIRGNDINGYFQNMTIKCRKESSFGGKSDIAIRADLTWWNGRDPATGQTGAVKLFGTGPIGTNIRKFKKQEVNSNTDVFLDWLIISNWDNSLLYNYLNVIVYSIYEKDGYTADLRGDLMVFNSGAEFYPTYFSNDDSYAHGTIFGYMNDWRYIDGYNVNTDCIKFNTYVH
jgi:hypothetical protein